MFKKNDRYLLVARIVLLVLAIVWAVAGAAIGIVCIVTGDPASAITVLISMPLIGLSSWFFGMLALSFLCDVKLVRNKLYEESNENLKCFLEYNYSSDKDAQEAPKYDLTGALLELKDLYDSGAISEEEYNKGKAKLLS